MELYTSHTDEHLFALMQNDDEKAFTELYGRYWKKLLVRANLLLDSQEDAEEIVHDIFVRLWRKRATLHILHSFHTYIAAMLQYGCFTVLAKRRRLCIMKLTDEVHQTGDHSTQQFLDLEDLREKLEVAVRRLPDKCQLIFRLSREQYLSDKEIAQKLDLSVNTVRTQMHRALHRLKISLSNFLCL